MKTQSATAEAKPEEPKAALVRIRECRAVVQQCEKRLENAVAAVKALKEEPDFAAAVKRVKEANQELVVAERELSEAIDGQMTLEFH